MALLADRVFDPILAPMSFFERAVSLPSFLQTAHCTNLFSHKFLLYILQNYLKIRTWVFFKIKKGCDASDFNSSNDFICLDFLEERRQRWVG